MSMQMSFLHKPKYIVLGLLVVVFLAIAYMGYELPSEARKPLGGCLIAAGVCNILLRRKASRWIFRLTQSKPALISKPWAFFGEEGVQFFYLGIGITFAVAGLFLLLMGTFPIR
jgi:hypothetical protein